MQTTDWIITTMFNLVKNRITQISLIWVTISLTATSRPENIPRITNLDCLNDYDKELFCFWEVVGSNSDCSKDFNLSFINFKGEVTECLDLRNVQRGYSVVPNECICNITVNAIAIAEDYVIKVKSQEELVANKVINIASTIKPKAPVIVQVDLQEEEIGVVIWDIGYNSIVTENLVFHVQILSKHSGDVTLQHTFTGTPKYSFQKKQLKRGEEYVVRVRAKPERELQGAWSEWSKEHKWRNDYSPSILDLMNIIIPVTCIVVLFLISVSYVCVTRYKNKWWDTIPSPAKSTIVKRKQIQKHRLTPNKNRAENNFCGSFFSRIVKAHKSKCDQLTQHDTAQLYVIGIVSSNCEQFSFEPKNEDIERCVAMYPKWEDENNTLYDDKPEYKAEDQPLEDLFIANLFSAILHDSSSIMVDTIEKLNTGTSGLMGSIDKEEEQCSDLNVSGSWDTRKLGYHNYDSDDSPRDSLSNIDVVHQCSFAQWQENEIHCIPYTPQIRNNSKWDLSGLNSFDNAIYEVCNDSTNDSTKIFCLDNFSKSRVLPHNAKYFCPYINEDSYTPNKKPKSGHVILQCIESKTSISQNSGYQSFHEAVQENELELGCHISGYKRFDQAVRQGDDTSVSEMNGYQSFHEAVQENELELGCHISGYKSLDQAVRQGDDTSVGETNRYKHFAGAVPENELGYHISGYKSFDQAAQEGDEISMSDFNGYRRFDEVLQKNETSGSTSCSIPNSGYKPFESLVCQNIKYSDKNGCICANDHRENNTNIDNSSEYRCLSSDLRELGYCDSVKATKEKYPSFSDNPLKAVKVQNDMDLKHEGFPLALTFDICVHLRNLENLHRHEVPLNNLQTGIIPMNEAIFTCNLRKVSFTQDQLIISKNPSIHKCPSTCTFRNASFSMPLYDLDFLDPSQTSTHLLIQQSSLDKDGNSYMKIK